MDRAEEFGMKVVRSRWKEDNDYLLMCERDLDEEYHVTVLIFRERPSKFAVANSGNQPNLDLQFHSMHLRIVLLWISLRNQLPQPVSATATGQYQRVPSPDEEAIATSPQQVFRSRTLR